MPAVARSLEEAGMELLGFYDFPKSMWKSLRTTNALEKGKFVKISIADTGVGIAEEDNPMIFDADFSTNTMGVQKGMGLGLAISYSIVKHLGGVISVESEKGKGSTFHVYLPAAEREDGTDAGATVAEPAAPPGYGRVPLMDDEQIIRDVAGDMLREIGCKVAVAEDGVEALETYVSADRAGRPFGAVMLDLTIPRGGKGREAKEVLDALRDIVPDMKAVASSGYSDDSILADLAEYGFSSILRRLCDVAELALVLARVTGKGRKNTG